MTDQNIYNIMTTIFYLFFGMIWKASTPINLSIKIFCILLSIAGGFLTLKEFGYIIKV
jgi:hypothetical protein